jgi:hypothetical protein
MKETPQQYTQRILGLLGGRHPVKVQSATAAKLERLTRGLSRRQMARRLPSGLTSFFG